VITAVVLLVGMYLLLRVPTMSKVKEQALNNGEVGLLLSVRSKATSTSLDLVKFKLSPTMEKTTMECKA
jgi:competence protein ComGC